METTELSESDSTSLTGHLLIAMPAMLDPNFHRTVSYICEHSDQGALGLVINRPLDMDFGEVMEQLALNPSSPGIAELPILQGGPVELQRGFVIHEESQDWDATVEINDSIFVTTSQDILGAMAAGSGPAKSQLVLGYAGWGPGQLEQEISENAWLSVPAAPRIIFDVPFDQRYTESVALLGIDLATLSSQAGHA